MIDIWAQLSNINVVKNILLPAATASGALWFATRKFKRERMWQDKYVSYQRVLDSIEAIRYWGEEISCNTHMLPTVGDFSGTFAADSYATAQREVLKQISIGTLLLSDEFVDKLDEFYREFYQERFSASNGHYDKYDDEYD